MQVQEVIRRIEEEAKTETADVRFIRTCEVGDEIRQGDIYLYPVDASILKKLNLTERTSDRQLAPGNTQGSRHIVEGDVDIYPRKGGSKLDGPILVAKERFTVTHPEHSHVSLPSRTYECVYQRDYEQEEIERVAD